MSLLAKLREVFDGGPAPAAAAYDRLQLAAAALMIEAARIDDAVGANERSKIEHLLAKRFDLDAGAAEELLAAAEAEAAHSSQLFGFTRTLVQRLEHEERVGLLEMLWEVVYADGRAQAYEANLMRRIAGLLHVPDAESGAARKRMLARTQASGA